MVRLEWCGNSYVILSFDNGIKIAIDPHDGGSIGLPQCRRETDYVLVTHNHFDHNAVEMASGNRTAVIRWRTGEFDVGGVRVEGYTFYHDKAGGSLRGTVTAYKIYREGISIVHLSDIGHIPPKEALKPFENVDVLLIPVGGVITIDAYEACKIISTIKPKLVIPIHFWMPGMTLPLDPLEIFLSVSKLRRLRIDKGYLNIDEISIPERTSVIIFERTVTGARTFA